ncbi:hypothetical protein AX16_001338 [Volvariella volvacea WC 439]|nr:hypothetical protein AX16_001338 [Volvariella volvacea WC 439]
MTSSIDPAQRVAPPIQLEPPAQVDAEVEDANAIQQPQPQSLDHPPPPPVFSANTFENATIRNIGGNFITTVGNGNTIYHTTVQARDNRARDMLREVVSRDAIHTNRILQCDPNTRQAIIHDIIAWMEDEQRDNNILWLCGPAGFGKSAIVKAIAERLDGKEFRARVAGSFFFFRSDPKRNTLQWFVPTLAYRLAISMKPVGKKIDKVVEEDPEILRSDVDVQWRKLIVEPLMSFSGLPPATMIIDGLDQCTSLRDQRKVLQLVASCGPYFPISFLISSRPESFLVNSFNMEPLSLICRVIVNLAEYKDDQEMAIFIRAGFSRIYEHHRDLLKFCLTDGVWPSDEVVDLIANRTDGQFVYPVTLFKLIGKDYGNPNERLKAYLEQISETSPPLDELYTQILRSSHEPDNVDMQDFLFLLTPTDHREAPTIQTMAIILDLNATEFRSKLDKLYPVISVPEDDRSEIRVYHQSFIDFLLDHTRSSVYHIDRKDRALRIVDRCLSALENHPPVATELNPLLQCWWSCSRLLSHDDVAPDLAPRMEKLNFDRILRFIPGASKNEFLYFGYGEFVKTCQSWVHLGIRISERPQDAEFWKNCSLLSIFTQDALPPP